VGEEGDTPSLLGPGKKTALAKKEVRKKQTVEPGNPPWSKNSTKTSAQRGGLEKGLREPILEEHRPHHKIAA